MNIQNEKRSRGLILHQLMPGAVLVDTPEGVFQIGAPFDAFKRMLRVTKTNHLPIPYILVAPEKSATMEMALWAPEFYVLHHLFLLGSAFSQLTIPKKVRLLVNEEHIPLARQSLIESITGPSPNQMRRWRRNGKRVMHSREIEMLTRLSDHMAIKRADGTPAPIDDFVEFAPIADNQRFTVLPNVTVTSLGGNRFRIAYRDETAEVDIGVQNAAPPLFQIDIPEAPLPRDTLGIVPLGNRSGFSTIGPNTGFLIWVNGHPVIFDGPYGTVPTLKSLGVHPNEIKAIVVSHVHEDHIGALMELVLLPHRPMILTSEPIYRSIVTKLAIYLDRPPREIPSYINYVQIHPGHQRRLLGADFNFFYTAHPIPTLGLRVSLPQDDGTEASLLISGDTYNLKGLQDMHRKGVVSRSMYKRLSEIVPAEKQDNALYLIDAGQSIIHGDDMEWADNPNDILFYHTDTISDHKDQPHAIAELGKQYTLLPQTQLPPLLYDRISEALHFDNLQDSSWIRTLMNSGKIRTFTAGSKIIRQGEQLTNDSDHFFVILSGTARVFLPSTPQAPLADLGPGEFFGEIAVLTGSERTATVEAISPLEAFEIPGSIFSEFVESNNLLPTFQRVWKHRTAIDRASLFRRLNARARNLISMSSKLHMANNGDIVFESGHISKNFFLVVKGAVEITAENGQPIHISATAEDPFFGTLTPLDDQSLRTARVTAIADDTEILSVPASRIRRLYEEAPIFRYSVAVALSKAIG